MTGSRSFPPLRAALLALALLGAGMPPTDERALATDFATLRQTRGHFDGAPWNAELDAWQGRKHQVMQALLARVRQGGYDAARVRTLLGAPDETWPAGDPEGAALRDQVEWQGRPAGELWAYHWRGRHDRLLFAFERGRLRASGWLYAGE
ncbi:hypothetical protein [Pseudomonas mangiferae]|uniref:Uncharacterized protein n=1 Tax=Pseudomonas mangiferae TaxID=2593654 RepID=A0A553GYN9_9PSED|nr:hypothetical protein [Pseudomonas mangiferae]TRX74613.1 hypothetical protein FM069_11435 [Pseudomonas mangiferae]